MVTAAAIVGGAFIGAEGSKKSARIGAKSQKDTAAMIQEAARRARSDVLRLFPSSQQALLTGAQGAFNIFSEGLPLQQQQLRAGNLAAQQSTSMGFDQARAALLGMPTGSFTPQSVDIATPSFLGQNLFGEPQQIKFEGGESINLPTFGGIGNVPKLPEQPPPADASNQGGPVTIPSSFLGTGAIPGIPGLAGMPGVTPRLPITFNV